MIYALECGNPDFTWEIIAEYFHTIQSYGYVSLDHLHLTVREFLVLLETMLDQFEIQGSGQIISDLLAESEINAFTQLDDFSGAIYRALERVFPAIKSNQKAIEKKNLYEIKDYIEKNYISPTEYREKV